MIRTARILAAFLATRHSRPFEDRAALEAWQELRIRRLLSRVVQRSPFYRDRIQEAGGIAAWRRMPVLDKTAMMASFSTLNTAGITREEAMTMALQAETSRDFSPTIKGFTVGLSSGTSGHRGLFLVSPREQDRYIGTILAKLLPGSLFESHRVAFFMRANSNLYSACSSPWLRFEFFDLLHPLETHLDRLAACRPTLLFGPPSVLRRLAESEALESTRWGVKKTFSIAEVLDPIDRIFLQDRFPRPLHEVYQCTEGFLGITCPAGTLHLNEDLVHIEKEWLDRPARKFVPIITDFRREAQPIIRYRLNDILTERIDPCPCGSLFTALASIEGRCDDILHFEGPKPCSSIMVYPDFIRRAILFADETITDYRVVQRTPGRLEVHLQVPEERRPAAEAGVSAQMELLARQLNARSPDLFFPACFPAPEPGRKLRRVEQRLKGPKP